MNHPKSASRLIFASILCTALSGCANMPSNQFKLVELPEVPAENAATLRFHAVDNFSDVTHHHVIRIDDQPVAIMKHGGFDSMQVAAGSRNLKLTCHTRVERDNPFPRNYTVVDGKASKQLDLQPGDDMCFKVGFAVTNCAVLTEAEPSYCAN